MKLLGKLLVVVAAVLVLAAARLEPVPASPAVQSHPFAPPNASWAHLFAAARR